MGGNSIQGLDPEGNLWKNEELLKSLIPEILIALSHLHFQQGHSTGWTVAGKSADKTTIDGLLKCVGER